MINTQTLQQRAAWSAFKGFAALRILTLLWVLLFALTSDRNIVEPDVLCRTKSLSEANMNTSLLLNSAIRWDTVCYLVIAESGYTAQSTLTVWPPLYPILIRLFSVVFQPSILAALVISSLATWLAFTALYILTAENYDEETAKNTLFLYVVFPSSFFLVSGYTESTFLLLAMTSLLLARHSHWGWAGLLSALATLTRLQGIFLSLALLCEGLIQYRENPERRLLDLIRPALAGSMSMLTFAVFSSYVYYFVKTDWPWQTLGNIWGHYTGFPWEGILGSLRQLLTVFSSTDLYWLPTTIVDLFFALLIPLTLGLRFRSMRLSFGMYAWILLFISLTKLGPGGTLVSFSRYALVIFPFFIALSPMLKNRHVRLGAFFAGIIFQGIQLYMFHIWSWGG